MLTAYVPVDQFHKLEEPFRALLVEWIGLLAASESVKIRIAQSITKSAVDDLGEIVPSTPVVPA